MSKQEKEKHGCSATVWDTSVFRTHLCSRRGTIERDGAWYCKQHDPVAIKEKERLAYIKWERDNLERKRKREEERRKQLHADTCVNALAGIENPAAVRDLIAAANDVRLCVSINDKERCPNKCAHPKEYVCWSLRLQNALAALDVPPADTPKGRLSQRPTTDTLGMMEPADLDTTYCQALHGVEFVPCQYGVTPLFYLTAIGEVSISEMITHKPRHKSHWLRVSYDRARAALPAISECIWHTDPELFWDDAQIRFKGILCYIAMAAVPKDGPTYNSWMMEYLRL